MWSVSQKSCCKTKFFLYAVGVVCAGAVRYLTQDCCDEISAPQAGCVEMSRGLNCIHGNIETSLVFSFILNRQSDLANQKKKKGRRPFYPDCLPQFPGEESAKLDFFLRGISSTDASPLSEASLIGFPYKYQSRQLGFSSVFPCAFVRLTQYEKETIKSSEMEEGAGRASRLQMLPLAGYCGRSGTHCSLQGWTFRRLSHRAGSVVLPSFLVTDCLICVSKQWRERLGLSDAIKSKWVLKLSYAFFVLMHIKFCKTVGKRAFVCRYDNDNYCIPLLITKYCIPVTVLCISTAHKQGWNKLRKGWEWNRLSLWFIIIIAIIILVYQYPFCTFA